MPKTYPHVKITEKAKHQKPELIAHRHLKKLTGTLKFYTPDGKVMSQTFSATAQQDTNLADTDWLEQKCDTFKICSGLYCSIWKDNPNSGFFFISGNKKSVKFDYSDLKHAPNRILTVLKYRKKVKKAVLSTTRVVEGDMGEGKEKK